MTDNSDTGRLNLVARPDPAPMPDPVSEPAQPLVTLGQLGRMRAALTEGSDDPILIAIHDYPDPDALASALALQTLGRSWGVDSTIVYGGGIGRPENAAMVSLLGIEIVSFGKIADLSKYKGAVFTDTQPAAKNQSLPASVPVLAVIDHHSLGDDTVRVYATVKAKHHETAIHSYHDVRTDVGSSSTLALGYMTAAGMVPDARLATALFTGIKTDTDSLLRDATPADVQAYTSLIPLADMQMVAGIARPPLGRDYFRLLDQAMRQTLVYSNCLIADCGEITSPDAISVISDLLIKNDGTMYALAHGSRENRHYFSLRVKPPNNDATRVILQTVGRDGKGGGHNLSAGGFVDSTEQNKLTILGECRDRFLLAVGALPKGSPLL